MSAVMNDAGKAILADGAAVTTSNTANGGNTNFTVVSGSPVKSIDTTVLQPPSDSAWYQIPTLTAAQGNLVLPVSNFNVAIGGNAGFWFKLTGYPSASIQFMRFGNSGQNYVGLNAAGKLYLSHANATVYTSPVVLGTKMVYWVSHGLFTNATTGVSKFGVWDSSGALLDTFTSAAGNTSATTVATCFFGKGSTSGNFSLLRLTSMRATTDSSELIPPVLPTGNRGWGLAA